MSITLEQIRDTAKRLAAEKPDFIYEPPEGPQFSCKYVDPQTGEGSCLIGQALLELGVEEHYLLAHNSESASLLNVWANDAARQWARRAQNVQDGLRPWGEAVEEADEAVGL